MPLMSIREYLEPAQLEAAYIGSKAEITPLGRAPMAVRVAQLEFDRLRMYQVDELTPRIKWTAQSPDLSVIQFLTQPWTDYIIDGATLRPDEVIYLSGGRGYYDYTGGPVHWARLISGQGLSRPPDQCHRVDGDYEPGIRSLCRSVSRPARAREHAVQILIGIFCLIVCCMSPNRGGQPTEDSGIVARRSLPSVAC